ncbi:MAG TPA: DUF881 domain-containing protein [Micromonosporaceae bacterium]|jgi:uncharacterized protein YlxW (UPF0749 family)|nr:DUF881 domain-containing protein [Micromonosporaceae bacterium]
MSRPSRSTRRPESGLLGDPMSAPEQSVDFLTELFRHPLDAGYSDAAAARERTGEPTVRVRRSGFVLRTLTLVATGLLLVVAYQQTVAAEPEAAKTRASLVQDVTARQAETDAQQRQAETLRNEAAKLRDAIVGPNASALDQAEARTGLGAVTGAGAVVTLASGPAPTNPVTGQEQANDQGHIVDFDLQVISNELWRDGAEAISINGQRLIATSTIRAAGSAILVDLAPLSEPYVIQAVGPPTMTSAVTKSAVGNFYDYLATTYGVHFSVRSASNLTLPAAADPGLRYATPLTAPSAPTTRSPATTESPRSTPPEGGP